MLHRKLVIYLLIALMSIILSYSCRRGVLLGLKGTLFLRGLSSSSWYRASNSGKFSTGGAGNVDGLIGKISNYVVSVAFEPKEREHSNVFIKDDDSMTPAKQSPTGEDNLFVSKEGSLGYVALGVADGVGGWAEAGYDSSAISRELCAFLKNGFESASNQETITPKELLINAFNQVQESPLVEVGGTTSCFGILGGEKLKVANMGDSWCGVFRDYKLIEQTKFQTHKFNTPYQLSVIPQHIIKQAESQGRSYIVDTPQMADSYEWSIQKDDIIMFATDGVTDNIVPEDIELYLRDKLLDQSGKDLQKVASEFVRETVKVSKDQNFPSAFAQELSKLTGQKYVGGKQDDITIVLVQVK